LSIVTDGLFFFEILKKGFDICCNLTYLTHLIINDEKLIYEENNFI